MISSGCIHYLAACMYDKSTWMNKHCVFMGGVIDQRWMRNRVFVKPGLWTGLDWTRLGSTIIFATSLIMHGRCGRWLTRFAHPTSLLY